MAFSVLNPGETERPDCGCGCECVSELEHFDTGDPLLWGTDPSTPWITAAVNDGYLELSAGAVIPSELFDPGGEDPDPDPPNPPEPDPDPDPDPPAGTVAGGYVRKRVCFSESRPLTLTAIRGNTATDTASMAIGLVLRDDDPHPYRLIWTAAGYRYDPGTGTDQALPGAPAPALTHTLTIIAVPDGDNWAVVFKVDDVEYASHTYMDEPTESQWVYLGGTAAAGAMVGDIFASWDQVSISCCVPACGECCGSDYAAAIPETQNALLYATGTSSTSVITDDTWTVTRPTAATSQIQTIALPQFLVCENDWRWRLSFRANSPIRTAAQMVISNSGITIESNTGSNTDTFTWIQNRQPFGSGFIQGVDEVVWTMEVIGSTAFAYFPNQPPAPIGLASDYVCVGTIQPRAIILDVGGSVEMSDIQWSISVL